MTQQAVRWNRGDKWIDCVVLKIRADSRRIKILTDEPHVRTVNLHSLDVYKQSWLRALWHKLRSLKK